MLEVYFAIYVAIDSGGEFSIPIGQEIIGKESYYSENSCKENAYRIAQGMFISSGQKYGFKCKPVKFEPPFLGN